jgi:hypothetical protein
LTIPTPDHLLEQAERLIALFPGKPPQTELRRSIWTACYGAFHFVLAGAADQYVGTTYRADPRYALAYRSASHAGLCAMCVDVARTQIPDRLQPYAPPGGFGTDMHGFAVALTRLKEDRLEADYDPVANFVRDDAQAAIARARVAITHFRSAREVERRAFLALLLFGARSRS